MSKATIEVLGEVGGQHVDWFVEVRLVEGDDRCDYRAEAARVVHVGLDHHHGVALGWSAAAWFPEVHPVEPASLDHQSS